MAESLTLYSQEVEHALSLQPGELLTLARPMEPQPEWEVMRYCWNGMSEPEFWAKQSPFGKIGAEFWVQEEWNAIPGHGKRFFIFKTGFPSDDGTTWHPSSTMKQEASRLTLIHKGTEVKRVQYVTEDECEAMNMKLSKCGFWGDNEIPIKSRKQGFVYYWRDNYGDKYPWDSNPWIFLGKFEVR